MESTAVSARASAPADDGRTRDRVAALLQQHGPQAASELAARLGLSPAGVRRHLDALVAAGHVTELARPRREQGAQRHAPEPRRGRGRPARRFTLTEAGRSAFPHAYDDLALTALRWIAAAAGPDAVRSVAERQLSALEERCSTAVAEAVREGPEAPVDRAQALAAALTAEGYAASASAIYSGGQLCQLHCPVAHVAAEFPQLCEAETAVIGRLVGTHVQRLATIAHGDGICTTHIPGPVPGEHLRAGNRPRPARPVPSSPPGNPPATDREMTSA